MGWKVNCRVQPGFLNLNLSFNEIRHIMDIKYGWNFTSFSELFCLFRFYHRESSVRILFASNPLACDCTDYVILQSIPSYNKP